VFNTCVIHGVQVVLRWCRLHLRGHVPPTISPATAAAASLRVPPSPVTIPLLLTPPMCQCTAAPPAPAPAPAPAPQAFRHLYVLAVQPRSVDAIDVDTKQVSVLSVVQL